MGGILFVCTGNASRSVMAEAMLRQLAPGWPVASAGTHSVDGQPISWRTRRALVDLDFDALSHRSRQATPADLAGADLIAVFESFQQDWVRRTQPSAAARTASLRRLAATLPPATPSPEGAAASADLATKSADLAARVAPLDLASTAFEPAEEVVDPGGGELADYVACAVDVLALVTALAGRLGPAPGSAPVLS